MTAIPTDFHLVRVFHETAQRFPKAPAIRWGNGSIDYQTLEARAVAVARRIERAIGSGKRVAVVADKSQGTYVGLLGALYSGNTYVPLSKVYPDARNAQILDLARVDAIVYETSRSDWVHKLVTASERKPLHIELDQLTSGDTAASAEAAERFARQTLAQVPAYILFTSGSTGTPKGVPITHVNVLHYLDTVSERFRFQQSDVFTHNFELTFDLSVFDMFVPWRHGAHFCVPDLADIASPQRYVRLHGITVWFSVPSTIAVLRRNGTLKPKIFPTLRLSFFCGEALTWEAADAWTEAAPQAPLYNLYGPTELTISCFAYEVPPRDSEKRQRDAQSATVPIGWIHEGHRYLLLNDQGERAQRGEDGELCVAGSQRFGGYLDAPTKSRESHVVWAHDDGALALYYRTGDLVRESGRAGLQYIGRIDHQVKINGFRIELEEVERAIRRLDERYHAVVRSVAAGAGDAALRTLVAFISWSGDEPDERRPVEWIQYQLKTTLPYYMVPEQVVWIDGDFPVNANGKIDLKALSSRRENRV
ncbi:amino acid adenylation domain-containing protein [Paraburkholderia tropica]|uniref:amino acid adenylation domain-containing protein n=1 Tax=Paraburkholderia tropica TaxID=92647 RepID=UPI002AB6A1A3|nr:amino acid adenylation domain-containing protein [Paraburkholderia tropica]